MLSSNHIKFHRISIETYVKELAKHLCKLDYSWWVRATFTHTLTAALEALCMTCEDH